MNGLPWLACFPRPIELTACVSLPLRLRSLSPISIIRLLGVALGEAWRSWFASSKSSCSGEMANDDKIAAAGDRETPNQQ